MLTGFSNGIIPYLAFAPNPLNNRAWLLNQDLRATTSLCGLDFYFHFEPLPSPPQKKAIWIKVLNVNRCNVWLRIQETLDTKEKRVELYSQNRLECCEWLVAETDYVMPQINGDFPNGRITDNIFFTHPVFQGMNRRVLNVKHWADIIDQMRVYLPCACQGIYN